MMIILLLFFQKQNLNLSKVAPQRFEVACGMSADCVRNKGLMAEVVGR
jgi:hypothetical protein